MPRLSSRSSARAGGNANKPSFASRSVVSDEPPASRLPPETRPSTSVRERPSRPSVWCWFDPLALLGNAKGAGKPFPPGEPDPGPDPGCGDPRPVGCARAAGPAFNAAPLPPGTGSGNLLEPGAGGVGEVATYAGPGPTPGPVRESPVPWVPSRAPSPPPPGGNDQLCCCCSPDPGSRPSAPPPPGAPQDPPFPPSAPSRGLAALAPLGPGMALPPPPSPPSRGSPSGAGKPETPPSTPALPTGAGMGFFALAGASWPFGAFAPPSRCVAASLAPSSSFPEPAPAVSPAGLADSAGFLAETPPSALAASASSAAMFTELALFRAASSSSSSRSRSAYMSSGSTNSSKSSWLRSR